MKTYAGIEATLLWRLMTGGADGALQDGGVFSGDDVHQNEGDDVHQDGGVFGRSSTSQDGGITLRNGEPFLVAGMLREPAADYAGMLEGMEAAQLLRLMSQVQERLRQLGVNEQGDSTVPGKAGLTSALSGTTTGKAGTVPMATASSAAHSGKEAGKGDPHPAEPAPEKLFIGRDYSIRLGSKSAPCLPFRPLVKALFILFLKHPEGILLKELETIYKVIAPNVDPGDRRKRIMRLTNLEDNSFSEKSSVLNAALGKLIPGSAAYKIQGYNGHPRRIPLDPLLIEWGDEQST